MPGGKIILEMVGETDQNMYIIGNPQITFFKKVYRRHTNFYKEYRINLFDTNSKVTFGNKNISTTIKHYGDLVGEMYLEVVVSGQTNSKGVYTVNHFGNSLLKKVILKIGGITVDTHYAQWYQIWKELYDEKSQKDYVEAASDATYGGKATTLNYTNDTNRTVHKLPNRMEGNCPLVFSGQSAYGDFAENTTYRKKIQIPLRFFFNNHNGLALPLCAMKTDQVELIFDFETQANLIGNSTNITSLAIDSCELYAEHYFLSKEEKTRFTNSTHQYLVEQLQVQEELLPANQSVASTELPNKNIELNSFHHPVKYLAWVVTNPGTPGNNPGLGPNYFTSLVPNSEHGNDGCTTSTTGSFSLTFNGEPTYPNVISMDYFTRILPKRFCKRDMPELDRIGIYSFALDPLNLDPSGCANFSNIKQVEINIKVANNTITTVANKRIYIFAVNYNIFQVASNKGFMKYKF